ncbi:hypothetical protein [Vibrio vulnificus]|uniref:hypothetical protein n=1 Tax=Vibrio vulnificus TaxID=672 RepID=UPI0011AFD075|nr:hypothetical protein [Vibrio vulnificus]EHU4978445.1 hypothetical protein [Vibrio vulnificus]MCU8447977.1 hypothetical protein [Vibrio vulnificus]
MNMVNLRGYIGKLGEVSLKHRSHTLVLSVIVMLVDPNINITFGSASLAGLGISVEPKQTFDVGFILSCLLLYRLVALWASALLANGTSYEAAKERAYNELDPARHDDEPGVGNLVQEASKLSRKSVYTWNKFQVFWELTLPTVLAIVAFITFSVRSYPVN